MHRGWWVLFHLWLAGALGALLAPFSVDLGVLDALRQPILLSAGFLLPLFLLFRQWWRGAAVFLAALFLSGPWIASGSMPARSDDRQISLIMLPSSSERALDYALSRSVDVIVVPDFSDRIVAQLGPGEKVWLHPTQNSPAPGALDSLKEAYQPWIVDGDGGLGVFLRRDFTAPDSIRLRSAPNGRTLIFDARIHGAELTFAIVHLARPFPIGRLGDQTAAVDALERQLADIPRPIILAGDFNALPWSAALARLGDAIEAAKPLWVGTFPAGLPLRLPLDQIRTGGGLTIRSLVAGPDVGSDHLPVEAVVSLAP